MRGKLDPLRGVGADDGLIPAHTGKTRAQPQHRDAIRAHPRSRGENCSRVISTMSRLGSSPLTQGKHLGTRSRGRAGRLIPAHAGKTPSSSLPGVKARAHPRSRGENPSTARRIVCHVGSSPLTRGKPVDRSADRLPRGLIPAHAGKTAAAGGTCSSDAAHPRSRGENGTALTAAINPTGSSPLTRGKLLGLGADSDKVGLIPAHARKTSHNPAHRSASTAHPRSRRENPEAPGIAFAI